MLMRIGSAIVLAIAVWLGLILLAIIVLTLNAPIAQSIGGFLKAYGWTIAALVGLWWFFTGRTLNRG